MPIMPISGNVLNSNQKASNINFSGGKSQLIPVDINVFKTVSAKEMYSKIQKYFKIIGDNGTINDVKVMHFGTHDKKFDYLAKYYETDTCLSINKNKDKTTLRLTQKYPSPNKKSILIMDALFDKNGQMIRGQFPIECLSFERSKGNVRRMEGPNINNYGRSSNCNYVPVGGNDREWDYFGLKIPSANSLMFMDDNFLSGAFEIFLELARLKTSILK